jgi:hypothetical protein
MEVPCRASAEIRQHQADLDRAESIPFDVHDDLLMADLCGKDLAPVIQDLLILETQIQATADSFGVNAERLARAVIPLLKTMREKFKDKWERA